MTSLLRWMAFGLGLGAFFSLAWWLLLEPATSDTGTTELVIPEGTAAAVAAGKAPEFIPEKLVLGRSGELRVVNRDVVDHRFGDLVVAPGTSITIRARSDASSLSCTVHPGGVLGVSVQQRPPLALMLLPTLLIGVPVGFVCWVAATIAGRLDMEHGPPGRGA